MISIDLITGFLGSGKTTFIRQYAKHLLSQGLHIGILENDFGAVNVDALLLQDILGENCTLEMVAGGCDAHCHRRRFKTKLIAMGMCGYDRVIVEPSGIFDMDEFFDCLHEDPLERWYKIENVITIIDANLSPDLSESSKYLLASQTAQAGIVLYSHTQETNVARLNATKDYVSLALNSLNGAAIPQPDILCKDWNTLTDSDYQKIMHSGYHICEYTKLWAAQDDHYETLYFMNLEFSQTALKSACENLFKDTACGNIFRIKGFQKLSHNHWVSVNATREKTDIQPVATGQSILIVIGEKLQQPAIEQYLGKSNP